MSDALNKNVPVYPAIYCEDEGGQPDSTTAMYPWCHIRAVGPNVLKDTTLCGTTKIIDQIDQGGAQSIQQVFYQVYLDPLNGSGMSASAPQDVDSWDPFGYDNFTNRGWEILSTQSPANTTFNIFGEIGSNPAGATPPPGEEGYFGIYNKNERGILCHISFTCTITGPVLVPSAVDMVNLRVGLRRSDNGPTDWSPLQPTINEAGYTYADQGVNIACDFMGVLGPGEWVTPVMNIIPSAPVGQGQVTPAPVIQYACMVAEFIDYNDVGPLSPTIVPGNPSQPRQPPPPV